MSDCTQCGMCVDSKEPYHPYAACLMFMGCKNGNTVQANLKAVVAHGAQRVAALEAQLTECKLQRDSWKRIAESGLGLTSELETTVAFNPSPTEIKPNANALLGIDDEETTVSAK